MRRSPIFAALVCAWPLFGQAADRVDQVRAQVEAGALPRTKLDEAEAALADSADDAILRRTLFRSAAIEEMTPQDGEDMSAAAKRMFERRQARLEKAKKLVDAGAMPRLSLTSYIEELDRSRRTLDLAQTRAALISHLLDMARLEQELLARFEDATAEPPPLAERYTGNGLFHTADFNAIRVAYEHEFSKPLPVSANGDTAVHRSLGFNHRGRVDVALDPDQPEGVWLRQYLESLHIPYYAFRTFLPGRATGPHIHIGPPSERLTRGG